MLTLLLMLIQAAPAAPPGLEAAFRNTIVSTYPDGRTARLWLDPGGTYRGQGRRGGSNSGVWAIDGENICFSQRRPLPMPIRYCTPVMRGDVGARWTAKAVTGETISVQLVAGR